MKILALDTALNACSAAVLDQGTILAEHRELRARGHAETLLPIIKDLMLVSGLAFKDLDALAVSVGPGTFTGLRIGLAAARGIALAAQLPCFGITTLEALAAAVPEENTQKIITVAIDARRKEVYLQSFRRSASEAVPVPLSEAKAVPVEQAASALPETPFALMGSGAPLLEKAGLLQNLSCQILDLEPDPDAKVIARLAFEKPIPEVGHSPAPLYLRAPDVKLPGGIDPATLPS
ncbi:MAG: tRNA (adenosine(37)-N6)-threonylcarbamoyltransferase complex dimerization subunit type 1 TsaB [Sneathiellales bacterium]|nr:tRNA (adenosine(37)-N6)-threonylcarbamoyltransferase complex dimerization subunit type 1 TsaB [Sneathiellales bacterium]